MAAFVASILGGQPLLISGVTGMSSKPCARVTLVADVSPEVRLRSSVERYTILSNLVGQIVPITCISWGGSIFGGPFSTGSRHH